MEKKSAGKASHCASKKQTSAYPGHTCAVPCQAIICLFLSSLSAGTNLYAGGFLFLVKLDAFFFPAFGIIIFGSYKGDYQISFIVLSY